MEKSIQMVDLSTQYERIKGDIDDAIQRVLNSSRFIGGNEVKNFENELSKYCEVQNVISCANGTDALQLALMALEIGPGDEVIVPAFTYISSAEVIKLLGASPVLVDIDAGDFNIDTEKIINAISYRTKAIIVVHLFGQNANMDKLVSLCESYGIKLIEDSAQSIGARYYFADGKIKRSGTMGDIGCTSFFPSKNLGCFGDGGAIFCNNDELASKIRIIANHGQNKKYYFKYIGVNSRLDTLQASILRVKLRYLDDFIQARQQAANIYDQLFEGIDIEIPKRYSMSEHVFHQYTIKFKDAGQRSLIKEKLAEAGIPAMIYYPLPIHKQEAYRTVSHNPEDLQVSESISNKVLSIPMHTELTAGQQEYICNKIKQYL
ncbi:MAG TPA: DegT/DnrJ/EryC1/StrS family aminotransferase [Cyclobacteriaceae bacterium]